MCSIYFHVDTVPPGAGWTRAPFELTREGDRLYGRGAADMKGTIAATLAALLAADAAGVSLAYDPVLLFCTDEEGGLYPGVRWLAEQHLIEGHVLCLNGGAAPRIWAGCFGSLDLAIRVQGRSAHSGDPGSGINAVEEALPGECTIIVNRRYPPEEEFATVRAELEKTIRDAASGSRALGIDIDLVGHLAPVADPDAGPYWPRWCDAVAFGFGYPRDGFRRWGASSSSDMGFVQQARITNILLGGLSRPERNVHAADEHTTIGDVTALARALLVYLADSVPGIDPA